MEALPWLIIILVVAAAATLVLLRQKKRRGVRRAFAAGHGRTVHDRDSAPTSQRAEVLTGPFRSQQATSFNHRYMTGGIH